MFITVEGMEGAGKSTLVAGLAAALEKQGRKVLLTREPGGCDLGRTLRALLLHKDAGICPQAELFLFLADRAQHVADIIRPALLAGKVVICDRFADSTVVYQGYGRGFDLSFLRRLNHEAISGLWPDVTLVLDLPPEEGLRRARLRNARNNAAETEGRFEAEAVAFHTRVRDGFVRWAEANPERCTVISGLLSPEAMCDAALERVLARG